MTSVGPLAPVTLEGRVIRLVPLDRSHAAGLVVAANEDRSTYDFTKVPRDETAMLAYIDEICAEQAAGRMLGFAVETLEPARLVGMTRFLDIEWWSAPPQSGHPPAPSATPSAAEVGGTWYAASVQRTAVNTEAKLLLLTFAFEVWGVERVSFKTDSRNLRSQRAIERLGAVREGVRRAHMRAPDGITRDSVFFSVLRSEWPDVKDRLERLLRGDVAPK